MRRKALAAGLALMLVGGAMHVLAGSGSAATVVVEARGNPNLFVPQDVTITAGDTVRWVGVGGIPHNVESDTGAFTSSPTLMDGDTYDVTFNTAGEYIYTCTIHSGTGQYPGGMTGKVIVQGAPTGTATQTSSAPTATRTPGPSSTPSRTATGTVTAAPSVTPLATATGVPATPFVAAPISATQPAGGADAAISPPQTGSGTARGGSEIDVLALAFAIGGFVCAGVAVFVGRRA